MSGARRTGGSRHESPYLPKLASRFPAEAFRSYPVTPEPESHYPIAEVEPVVCAWDAQPWPCALAPKATEVAS